MPMWLIHSSSERRTRSFWLRSISKIAGTMALPAHASLWFYFEHSRFDEEVAVASRLMTSSTSAPSAGLQHPAGIPQQRSQESLLSPSPPLPRKTHMCAADPLQQETCHLRLAIELGLREPQLVFCLQDRTGCWRQHQVRTLLCLFQGEAAPASSTSPSGTDTCAAGSAGSTCTRDHTLRVRIPDTSGCIST